MIKALILYTQFFTRLPLPIAIDEPIARMKGGVPWFTLFGALVGLIEAACFYLVSFFLPIPLSFFITLFVDVLVTGGFHQDALCDTADGLFSSRKKERMLEIMKDSRIGSNGVLALLFYYGIMMGLVLSFQELLSVKLMMILIICLSVVGKGGITMLFYRMRYAGSSQGLGTTFVGVSFSRIVVAQLIAALIIGYFLSIPGLLAYSLVFFVSLLYKQLVYAKVDGLNGDTLGAFACVSQLVFLLVYFGARSWLG